MKIKKIAATLGIIAIVGSSLTAAAITKQTATGYFEGWTTWFGAGTVNSEHVDYAHDWWSASVKNGDGEYAVNYKYAGEHDEEIAKAKEDAIAFKKDYAYYNAANFNGRCACGGCWAFNN